MLPEYQMFSKIYESVNSLVYRATKRSDCQLVILKVLRENYPTSAELTRYKQEYEITRYLNNSNIDGVIRAFDLKKYQNTLVMTLEDFGGESLKILSKQRKFSGGNVLTLQEFLTIAIRITRILGKIHSANVIHKDINPYNIILNPTTKEIKIIDFGISSVLSKENPILKNPNILEGTLGYISPEQTGRMNRSLDYRTDFYSLGVTFYELLTHQLPFVTTVPRELVYCHIAKQPVIPCQVNPQIPSILSDLILKLMAKNAEDRYQSTWGIEVDLENCLDQLNSLGHIESFSLGARDYSDKLHIPEKLYGRETEVNLLLGAFKQVTSAAKSGMILVAGYSGIGKSVLVQEVYKPITEKHGYFISGKFDQFKRNIPYSAIIEVFQELIRQLLTENYSQLEKWRKKLLFALGPNAQVIINVIPEVELIVGKQPPVPELAATESGNRFNLVFQNFIRIFGAAEHPLVIFLDDLQWVDSASLKLIKLIVTDTDMQYLLTIGAYRDNEISANHPFKLALEDMHQQGVKIEQITLAHLSVEYISQMIAETTHSKTSLVGSLAELVMDKTGGNPFFVKEFIKTLHTKNLFKLNRSSLSWEWNIAEIEAINITDNVVALMINKLNKLPESTQQVLHLAACVGNKFNLKTLSIIQEKEAATIYQNLISAIRLGLILPTSELEIADAEAINSELIINNYKFSHDRIQQAAYCLIKDEEKKALHLRIGRLFLAKLSQKEREENFFDLIDHLNISESLITNPQERSQLVQLNLKAGEKAKNAMAYAAAQQYLSFCMKLVSNNIWQEDYPLALSLYTQLAETEYLNGNFQQSQTLIDQALVQARSALDRVELYILLIVELTLEGRYREAIQTARQSLRPLGIDFPEDERVEAELATKLVLVKENISNRQIFSLLDAPAMTCPQKKAAMRVLINLYVATYAINQDLYVWTIITMVDLSLKYGHVPESAKGYANYGHVLNSRWGDYKSGYEFGMLGLKLSEKLNVLSQKALVLFYLGAVLNHWVKPLKSSESLNNEAYQACLEVGSLSYAGYILGFSKSINNFSLGENLEKFLANLQKFYQFAQKTKNNFTKTVSLGGQIGIWNLCGKTANQGDFHTDEISETEYVQMCHSLNSLTGLCFFKIIKSQALYLYEELESALQCIQETEQLLDFVQGTMLLAEYNFYTSLILAGLYPKANEKEQNDYWEQIIANQKQMKIWGDNCPENFAHKYLLVEAEIARIRDKDLEAMDLYDRAISLAKNNDFIYNEALANELAAKFWLDKGKEAFAFIYLKQAWYGYQLWGSERKLKNLQEKYQNKYPELTAIIKTEPPIKVDSTTTTGTLGAELDLEMVMDASQAIAAEIVLDKLIEKLMKILMQNAGARNAFLILKKGEQLVIEAQNVADKDKSVTIQSIPVTTSQKLPLSLINYVARTGEEVVLADAINQGRFKEDPYIIKNCSKSILCKPIIHQTQLIGLIYLENNLTPNTFTPKRLKVLELLSAQIAISLENAKLYKEREIEVIKQTKELLQTVKILKTTQAELKFENALLQNIIRERLGGK